MDQNDKKKLLECRERSIAESQDDTNCEHVSVGQRHDIPALVNPEPESLNSCLTSSKTL